MGQQSYSANNHSKWIASVINSYEGWIEYRGQGLMLKNVSAGLNNGLIQ
jgi:hypothetical protein